MTDYQRIFVDSVIEDAGYILSGLLREGLKNKICEDIKIRLESRIVAYDQERKDQIMRDMPAAIERALRDVL